MIVRMTKAFDEYKEGAGVRELQEVFLERVKSQLAFEG